MQINPNTFAVKREEIGSLERDPVRSMDTKIVIYHARYNAFPVTSMNFIVESTSAKKNWLASYASCVSEPPDKQNINHELGRHVDPTLRPDLPLFPP